MISQLLLIVMETLIPGLRRSVRFLSLMVLAVAAAFWHRPLFDWAMTKVVALCAEFGLRLYAVAVFVLVPAIWVGDIYGIKISVLALVWGIAFRVAGAAWMPTAEPIRLR